jgi:hypothetical protein
MESKGFGRWVSVGANLAVLAGLILVAIQLRQNTVSTRAAAYQSTTWTAMACLIPACGRLSCSVQSGT